jgi:hypothetical protein
MAVVAAAEQAEAFLAVMVMEKVVNQASQVALAVVTRVGAADVVQAVDSSNLMTAE